MDILATGFDVGIDTAGIGRVGGALGTEEAESFQVALVTAFGGLVFYGGNAVVAECGCRVGTTGKVCTDLRHCVAARGAT